MAGRSPAVSAAGQGPALTKAGRICYNNASKRRPAVNRRLFQNQVYSLGNAALFTWGRLFLYVSEDTKDDHAEQVQERKHFEHCHGDHLHPEEQPFSAVYRQGYCITSLRQFPRMVHLTFTDNLTKLMNDHGYNKHTLIQRMWYALYYNCRFLHQGL